MKTYTDYWLDSEQILKAATVRPRELKSLIELLPTPSHLAGSAMGGESAPPSIAEVELGKMLDGITESAGSYSGRGYTTSIK